MLRFMLSWPSVNASLWALQAGQARRSRTAVYYAEGTRAGSAEPDSGSEEEEMDEGSPSAGTALCL